MKKGNGWTLAHRQQQAQRIHQWQPWAQSTGPKTAAGKATASGNADKGGNRPMLRELGRLLRQQREQIV